MADGFLRLMRASALLSCSRRVVSPPYSLGCTGRRNITLLALSSMVGTAPMCNPCPLWSALGASATLVLARCGAERSGRGWAILGSYFSGEADDGSRGWTAAGQPNHWNASIDGIDKR